MTSGRVGGDRLDGFGQLADHPLARRARDLLPERVALARRNG